jgi:hypothetical protein
MLPLPRTLALTVLALVVAGCGGGSGGTDTSPLEGTYSTNSSVSSVPIAVTPSAPVVDGTWSAAADMTTARSQHTATLLSGGKVLVAGGDPPPWSTGSAELYDPVANTWSPTPGMQGVRTLFAAVLLQSGKVLVVGGFLQAPMPDFGTSPTASAELYDPVTNTWSPAASMSVERGNCVATLLPNGKVLVAGGTNTAGSYLAGAEIYNPATDTWSPAASMTTARAEHTATLLSGGTNGSGQVLVVSGESVGGPTPTAELYDVAANTWSPAGSLSTGLWTHTATLLPNGKVLVAGGSSSSSVFATTDAELYDAGANTWSPAASMTTARTQHTATLLQSGLVLVVGGYGLAGAGPWASAEVYDPAADAWIATADMSAGRREHTATLLSDGRVLVTGGGASASATAELYSP